MKKKFSKVVALVLAMAMVMVIGAVPAMAEDAGTGGTAKYPAFSAPYTETFDWVGDTWEDPDDTDGSFTNTEQIGEYNKRYDTYEELPNGENNGGESSSLPNGMRTGADYTRRSSVIFTNDGMYLDAYKSKSGGTDGYATVIVPEVAGLKNSYKVSATFQKMLYEEKTTADKTFNPRPYIRAAISADEKSFYELRLNATEVVLSKTTNGVAGLTRLAGFSIDTHKTEKFDMELEVYPEGDIIFSAYVNGDRDPKNKRPGNGTYKNDYSGTYKDSAPIAVNFEGEGRSIPAAVGVYSKDLESAPVKFSKVSVRNNTNYVPYEADFSEDVDLIKSSTSVKKINDEWLTSNVNRANNGTYQLEISISDGTLKYANKNTGNQATFTLTPFRNLGKSYEVKTTVRRTAESNADVLMRTAVSADERSYYELRAENSNEVILNKSVNGTAAKMTSSKYTGTGITTNHTKNQYLTLRVFENGIIEYSAGVDEGMTSGAFYDPELLECTIPVVLGSTSNGGQFEVSSVTVNNLTELPAYKAAIGNTPYKTLAEAAEAAVSGDTVTLLADATEEIKFADGVNINYNGFSLTVPVAKIGKTNYATLAEAVEAATAGDTVTLLADVELAEALTIAADDEIVLDLNGKTVSMNVAATEQSALITNNGTLTIEDSGENGKLTYVSSKVSTSYSTSTIINNGTLTVESGTIENTSARGGAAAYAIDSYNTLTVKGGTITAANTTAIRQVQNGANETNVNITGGTISGGYAGLQVHILNANKNNTTNITGGTFTGAYAFYTTFYNIVDSSNTEITVNGGTFNGDVYFYNGNKDSYGLENVSVTDGTFNGETYVYTKDADGNMIPVKAIEGGTYANDVSDYCADGMVAKKNDDGKYGIVEATYVAKVGETSYESLAEAVEAATAGDTVKLLADVELADTLTIAADKKFTLDLNGKTISGTCSTNQVSLIKVANGASLTIKDSSDPSTGKITYAGNDSTGWIVDVEGNLVLESGTLELTGTWNIGYAVDVRPNAWGTAYTEETSFVMNGGKIVSSDGGVRVASTSYDAYKDVSASFTMEGGEINAAWDGVFVQQSNAIWDVLNVTINNGTIESGLNPIRFYGPAATSYVNGEDCVDIELNGGNLTYTGEDESLVWLVDGILRIGGGVMADEFLKDSTVTASADFAANNAAADGYKWDNNGKLTKVAYVASVKDADGNVKNYESLAEAVAAATAGDTVTLLADVELADTLTIAADDEITLDLNGKTVSMNVAATEQSALITNNGNLTIKDSGENGKLTYVSSKVSTSYSTSTVINNGTLTVESGTIENTSARGGAAYAIDSYNTLTVKGGTITAANTTAIRQVQNGANETNVNITGGTISGGYAGMLVHVMSNAKETNTVIENGTFKGTYALYTYFTIVDSSNTEIEISGGTYDGYVMLYNGNNGSTNLNVSITDGTFGETYVYTKDADGTPIPVKAIEGGTYGVDVSDYCADGYKAVANEDETYGVVKMLTLTANGAIVKGATGVVMFASYDENGKLIQANYAETTGGDVPVNVTLEGAKTLKAMFWESITSIRPLCNAEEIPLN